MQAAIDHIESKKVFVEALGVEMVPLVEAYRAVQLSVDQQLSDMTSVLENSLGKLGIDINQLQNELENDQDSTRESEIDL